MSKFRIRAVWAYVALNDDGDEGVVAFLEPATNHWMPLVAADRTRLDSLRPVAQKIASEGGFEVKLVRFDRRKDIDTVRPMSTDIGNPTSNRRTQ